MLIASRRGRWLFVMPLLTLGAAVGMAGLEVLIWQRSVMDVVFIFIALLCLGVTVSGTRWARRRDDLVQTWEPELWAPWRTRQLKVKGLKLAFRAEGRSNDLILSADHNTTVCLSSYLIGYESTAKRERDSKRVAAVLELPEP